MPKRKNIKESDSDLSPPPKDLIDAEDIGKKVTGPVEEARPTKRRKAIADKIDPNKVSANGGIATSPPRQGTKRKRQIKVEIGEEVEPVADEVEATPKKRSRKKEGDVKDQQGKEGVEVKVKVKRKSKADKERELVEMPLAARTVGHKLLIGAHVSAAGGSSLVSLVASRLHTESFRRGSPSRAQLRPHRCQCFRAVPKITTQMGESTIAERALQCISLSLRGAQV
jgi:hypothetical protein